MIESIECSSDLEGLLGDLVAVHGADFTGYDRVHLERRLRDRMTNLGVQGLAEYRAHLRSDPGEYSRLCDGLLVHVTSFFRDREAWGHLATDALPRILRATSDRAQVRVWSAGCSTGEEAFSLAMLLAEAMGDADYAARVKLFATDRDERVLARARRGVFTAAQLRGVPDRLVRKYFLPCGDLFLLAPSLLRSITFGRLDLVRDVPISRLDLLVCRNTLMYLQPAAQQRLLMRFSSALHEGAVLFLGAAELPPLAEPRPFEPLSLQHHIFTNGARTNRGDLRGARTCAFARPT